MHLDRDSRLDRVRFHLFDPALHDPGNFTALAFEHQVSQLHPFDIEDVVDQPDQPLCVGRSDLKHPLPLLWQCPEDSAGEETKCPTDGCKGSP